MSPALPFTTKHRTQYGRLTGRELPIAGY